MSNLCLRPDWVMTCAFLDTLPYAVTEIVMEAVYIRSDIATYSLYLSPSHLPWSCFL